MGPRAERPAAGLSTTACATLSLNTTEICASSRRPYFPAGGFARRGVAPLPQDDSASSSTRMFPTLIRYSALEPRTSTESVLGSEICQRPGFELPLRPNQPVATRKPESGLEPDLDFELEPEPEPEPELQLEAVAQFLRETPTFAQLTGTSIAKMARVLELRHFAQGDCIVKQDNDGDAFYIIRSGRVRFAISEIASSRNSRGKLDIVGRLLVPIQRELHSRQCFGHTALLNEHDLCSASAVAVTPTSCYVLPNHTLSSGFCFRLLFPLLRNKLGQLFIEADEDDSKDLDKVEMKRLLVSLGLANVSAQYVEAIWDQFDADNCGALKPNEVVEMVEFLARERLVRQKLTNDENDDVWETQREPAGSDIKIRESALDIGKCSTGTVPKEPYTGPRAEQMERVRDIFVASDVDFSGALDRAEVRAPRTLL